MSIEDILNEREKTHGDYSEHARVTQGIKSVIHLCQSADGLTFSQIEALDMIAHKIGRIMSGDPNHKDHWDDIAGYATLVSREIEKLK